MKGGQIDSPTEKAALKKLSLIRFNRFFLKAKFARPKNRARLRGFVCPIGIGRAICQGLNNLQLALIAY